MLQFADIQDGPKVSSDTIRLIEASLDTTRPDIVIFTGNQIAGYDTAYADTFPQAQVVERVGRRPAVHRPACGGAPCADLERTREKVRGMIAQFTAPLTGTRHPLGGDLRQP